MNAPIKFIRLLVYSNVFISLCAASLTDVTFILLKIKTPQKFIILLFVFCATFFIYNFQRLVRLTTQNVIGKDIGKRLSWIISNKNSIALLSIISLIIATICFIILPKFNLLILIISSVLSVFYVIPIIPIKNKWLPIRKIPYLKIFIIALVWVLITSLFPMLFSPSLLLNQSYFLLFLAKQYVFILAITLPFDIRDLKFDLKTVKTIPMLIGVKPTIVFSEILLFTFGLISFFQFHHQFISIYEIVALQISTLITMIIIGFTNQNRAELFFSGLIDGTILLLYFSVLLAQYLSF